MWKWWYRFYFGVTELNLARVTWMRGLAFWQTEATSAPMFSPSRSQSVQIMTCCDRCACWIRFRSTAKSSYRDFLGPPWVIAWVRVFVFFLQLGSITIRPPGMMNFYGCYPCCCCLPLTWIWLSALHTTGQAHTRSICDTPAGNRGSSNVHARRSCTPPRRCRYPVGR